MNAWREACIALCEAAGAAILEVYAQDFDVASKQDDSPLTQADLAAHRVIAAGLQALTPDIPLLSEEGAGVAWSERQAWDRYWLVDPLDGTREFVKKNGEFTVNIALVERGRPVLGVVYAPVFDYLLHAIAGEGAWLRQAGTDIAVQVRQPATLPLRVAASRSHLDPRTAAFLERIGDAERHGLGSSLKFCRIAEGRIDLYPRFGPTSEWDTAAAQCVLEAAGGAVLRLDGTPLAYNGKESLLNPDFIAVGDRSLPWQDWLADAAHG
ncbi:MAG: 3'(2'),5'-bisphosphate nucleotidase CysQ [Arenimonas sp.]|nr:3'(2'),5'-bisphosphate nucleotidase CysQ [Arenimonas sp.]MBP6626895.1 3'(2'),5'-bisphosphate nucleotidase CysQ [Arenimonas sp.]